MFLTGVEPHDAQSNENESCVSDHTENSVGNAVAVDDVKPIDSVSHIASRTSKKRSSAGNKSTVSSTLSAHIQTEADVAAPIARRKLLKDKHALEEQEEQFRKRKAQRNLEMEIAASGAKINVLRASDTSRVSSVVRSRSE